MCERKVVRERVVWEGGVRGRAVWKEGGKGGWCGRDIASIHSLRGGRISHDQLYFTIGYNLLASTQVC